jgi:centrosomal protein CEP44
MSQENPQVFLQILHYILIDFSSELYKYFLSKNYELYSKNDMRFMENVYQIIVIKKFLNSF